MGIKEDEKDVRMLLIRDEQALTAYCVFKKENTEHMLTGSYHENSNGFTLSSEDMTIEIEGIVYEDADNKDQVVLSDEMEDVASRKLFLERTSGGGSSSRDELYEYYDTQMVEDFTDLVVGWMKEDNRELLCENMRYPVGVYFNNCKFTINSAEDFILYYDQIMTSDYREAIQQEFTRYLFADYQGVHFGSDNGLWFSPTADGDGFEVISLFIDQDSDLGDKLSYDRVDGIQKG
ncbi:MAG: hypothetical protein R3Y47_12375 [Lachnospiraceae bacterium]